MIVRNLDPADYGYALFTWREGAKKAPGVDRMPWSYFKDTTVRELEKLLDDPSSVVLGAYTEARDALVAPFLLGENKLVGWLVMTPGKRVHTLHWVHVKHELDNVRVRRRGVMTELIDAAHLGKQFVYTLRARRDRAQLPDGSFTKSLDESLAVALRARGMTATYVPLKEWLK